jgi:hypothetical protein
MKCIICGKDNAPGKIYCTGCGNHLAAGQGTGRACPRCGAPVAAHKSFCTQCGAGVPASQPIPAQPQNPSTPAEFPVPGNSAFSGLVTLGAVLGGLVILGVISYVGWRALRGSRLTAVPDPSKPHILVSRLALSNGRTDVVRPTSPANPMGVRAWADFGNPEKVPTIPGLLTTIAAQANPMMITLDQDKDGLVDGPANPIKADADKLRTCFSLLVAESFPAAGVRWENVGDRDGKGSLIATVSISSANIFAGMELITDEQLDAYTANSIIYEAPDWGVSPAMVADQSKGKGGRIEVRAAPRPQPPIPHERDLVRAPEINYANDVKVDIEVVSTCKYHDGGIGLTLQANLTGFDPVGDSHFRWAYHSNKLKIVKDVAADNRVTFHLPAEEAGEKVNLWVAVSSRETPSPDNINPFVQQPPEQYIGPETFVTVGSAVGVMISVNPLTPKGKCDDYETYAGHKTDHGSYRWAQTKVSRIYWSGEKLGGEYQKKSEEEVLDGTQGSIKHINRAFGINRGNSNHDYEMEAILTVDAPQTVTPNKAFNYTVTLDVNWNYRYAGPAPPSGNCFTAYLVAGYAKGQWVREEKTLDPSSVITSGRYSLHLTLTHEAALGLAQTLQGISAYAGTCFGRGDTLNVALVYKTAEVTNVGKK